MININLKIVLLCSLLNIYMPCIISCAGVNSYVDPKFHNADVFDLKKPTNKYGVFVIAEFQKNGTRAPKVDDYLKKCIEEALNNSGVIIPSANDDTIKIKVVVNNYGNRANAISQGIVAGISGGLIGAYVTDYYEATVTLIQGNEEIITKKYNHALHTTTGFRSAPIPDLKPVSPADGFKKIIEDIIINFIKDMQNLRKLSLMNEKYHFSPSLNKRALK